MGQPTAHCNLFGLRSVHRSDAWKAQRQRNHRRCLFITIRPAIAGAQDHEKTPGNEEKPEAMRPRNGHKRKDAAGVGDQPISVEFDPAEQACEGPGFGSRNLLTTDSSQDPLTKELRLLCRDEVALIRDRSALITQLRQTLYDYYPAALEAFDDWTMPAAWSFVVSFPTPQVLVKAGKRKREKFLHVHKLARPATYQRRLEIFTRAHKFAG